MLAGILKAGLPDKVTFELKNWDGDDHPHVYLDGEWSQLKPLLEDESFLDSLAETFGQDITWHIPIKESMYE